MATLGPRRFAALLVQEADLHGIVAVPFLVPDLQHWARPHLQHRHRREVPLIIVHLRHTHFEAQQAECHSRKPLFRFTLNRN